MLNNKADFIAIKITAVYLVIGSLWVLLSDRLVGSLAIDKSVVLFYSLLKGCLYVTITGVIIYFLINNSLKKLRQTEHQLKQSCEAYSESNVRLEQTNRQLDESRKELEKQYLQTLEDQKTLKEYQQKLHHLAYHDQLTGLQNRFSLIEKLNVFLNENWNSKYALLYIDIDNFKYINDTMGHRFGDLLLVKIRERLTENSMPCSSIFRLGGDEFVVLVENFQKKDYLEKLSVNILKIFKHCFVIEEVNIFITVSIGVSIYPEHGTDTETLLKNADIAVYKAKETGKNRIVFYNSPMNEEISERMIIEKHLRKALDNDEFELYYQPQFDIKRGEISGFEALLRWRNPELGFISPLKFISVAESTHLIIPIGEWVLRAACSFLSNLEKMGYKGFSISINISMLQLLQEDFAHVVIDIIDSYELNPMQVELEITESILMESYEVIAGKLKLLRTKGVKIALDDFGKGYSSLNYLKTLPITTLKIDKSFIDTISSESKDKSLTDLIVKIGRSMDLCVVAEGVETQEQMDYLVRHKCHKIQGYLLSKPMQEVDIIQKVREQL